MSETTNKNQLLLFGDYGTEVVKLSQLYVPENCIWQPVGDTTGMTPNSSVQYAIPGIKNKTVFFDKCAKPLAAFDSTKTYYFYVAANEGKEQSRYVPAAKSIVVVDESSQYSQYTLMVVDWVEDGSDDDQVYTAYRSAHSGSGTGYVPTYRSHLKPINFTSGIDQATRAVDYQNDRLMLYVEDVAVTPIAGSDTRTTVQRLIPDRKLMMYGPRPLLYVMRLGDGTTILNTNTLHGAGSDNEDLSRYVTAMFKPVNVTSDAQYAALSGSVIQYYDTDTSVRTELTVSGSDPATTRNKVISSCKAGYPVYVITNSDDTLIQVQLPEPCYLRSSQSALTNGQIVTMDVYEVDEGSATRRMIMSVKLHTRTAITLDPADLRKGTVVGFDVLMGTETTPRDIWQVNVGTTSDALKSGIHPYLLLENGEKQAIDVDDSALKIYGAEVLDSSPSAGTEFEILFKFFPYVAAGIQPTMSANTRYAPTKDTTPQSTKQYFVTDDVSASGWKLAGTSGTVTTFETGVKYYEKVRTLAWEGVVNRPVRDFLVCRKRITINTGLSAQGTTINHISIIPLWDRETEGWDFKYLVYKKDYSVPKLLTRDESDTGYITGAYGLPYGTIEDYKDGDIYFADLYYKPNKTAAAYPKGKSIALSVAKTFGPVDYSNSNSVTENWLIGGAGSADPNSGWVNNLLRCPYGRHDKSLARIRPRIECWKETVNGDTVAKFQIPLNTVDGFPNLTTQNWFIDQFYKAALDDEDLWSTLVEPNCFRIRAVEDGVINGETVAADDITSDYFVIDEGSKNQMSYGVAFECPGIRIPTDPDIEVEYANEGDADPIPCMPTVVVVEFAYSSNGQILTLLGVPVEVYRIAKNPAE